MYTGNCIAAAMSSKLEPIIWSRDTGHIGLHGEVDGRTVAKSQIVYHNFCPWRFAHAFRAQSSAVIVIF